MIFPYSIKGQVQDEQENLVEDGSRVEDGSQMVVGRVRFPRRNLDSVRAIRLACVGAEAVVCRSSSVSS